MDGLDNQNVIAQRDPHGALGVAATEADQLLAELEIINAREAGVIEKVVVTGMGGSALAALVAKDWLDLHIPFEVIRSYDLPKYVDEKTLVIASSYSGNTEETLSALGQAQQVGAIVAVLATGGKLIDIAEEQQLPYIALPHQSHIEPRMALFSNLLGLITLLDHFQVTIDVVSELRAVAEHIKQVSKRWVSDVPVSENSAKQLAGEMAGKTPIIYASNLMQSIAYKWKISFNENSKNVAYNNELPEMNHNEFIGWSSHPVQKPFGVIDLRSSFDHPRVAKRFELTDRLLSGKRPKSLVVELQGETMLEQMLYGCVLADFVSIYLAILNGVDPTPVELVEKLKAEMVS